ncbi:hypothetical protein B0H17DRAFT_1126370 [Mycena rosella]|uniref:Uncharacterized protein n=1 Tax=Mycena rosella TaxID=1033263 RepID=A0AAD7M8M3_MYCRO|nr:hypothetical protein B0H17DRAFT_1126370 [Mycena rosella]
MATRKPAVVTGFNHKPRWPLSQDQHQALIFGTRKAVMQATIRGSQNLFHGSGERMRHQANKYCVLTEIHGQRSTWKEPMETRLEADSMEATEARLEADSTGCSHWMLPHSPRVLPPMRLVPPSSAPKAIRGVAVNVCSSKTEIARLQTETERSRYPIRASLPPREDYDIATDHAP